MKTENRFGGVTLVYDPDYWPLSPVTIWHEGERFGFNQDEGEFLTDVLWEVYRYGEKMGRKNAKRKQSE